MPGESFNNITVGALADNKIPGPPTGLAALKELPAYYTRKHYIDYTRKINGADFKRSQMNYNINKPDIVMPGGDQLGAASGMQVLGFEIRETIIIRMQAQAWQLHLRQTWQHE